MGSEAPRHGLVKQFQELGQRGLVHDVDHAHLRDEEVGGLPRVCAGQELSAVIFNLDLILQRRVVFTDRRLSAAWWCGGRDGRFIIYQGT